MKIMFYTLSLREGGAERVISVLANEMSRENDVSVVTVHKNKDHYVIDRRIKRIYVDKKTRKENAHIKNKINKLSFARIKRTIDIVKKEKPDVVIAFLPLPSLYLMVAKKYSKCVNKTPVIISERCDPNREYKNKVIAVMAKRLYRKADGFVFQTEEAKAFFADYLKCKTTIIANPINEVFLNHAVAKERKNTIVSCGRLEAQKNYQLLIRSFSDISPRFPEYNLEIYGEGSQRDELLKLADSLGVGDKVCLRGRVDNIADAIYDASVFVLSSNYEGMPNALMEAMALGIPCVSTDCPVGGPRALIKDGYNGLLVPVNNTKRLDDALCNIFSNQVFASKLSNNAVMSSKEFKVERIVAKWRALIRDVVVKDE